MTRHEGPTTDRICASSTLFGVKVAEAAQAIRKLIPGGKALSGQLLLASSADKALLMPGLLPVSNASWSDSLFMGSKTKCFLEGGSFVSLVERKSDEVFVGGRKEKKA